MASTVPTASHPVADVSAHEAMRGLIDAVRGLRTGLAGLAQDPQRLRDVLALTLTDELPALFGDLVGLRALAEGLSTAVLDESVRRGVVAEADSTTRPIGPKITDWVQAQAAAAGAPMTRAVAGTYRRCWEQSRRAELAPLIDAIAGGRISLAVGTRLGADLATLSAAIPADWWQAAATELIEYAATGASAADVGSVREALIATYGPDGAFEEDQAELHRHRFFTTPTKDATGMWVGSYAMNNDDHAALVAALDALAAPCRTADGQIDTRTTGQRNLDAIIEMCRVVASDPTLMRHTRPASAAKAQIIITIGADAMEGRLGAHGFGTDGHDHPLTPETIRRLACDAHLIPAVLGSDSAVLDLGRSARFATPDQVRYLRLRDKGCTFPGCDRPPSWCEAHHLREWQADLGETNVDQLALLCTRHHTDIHARRLRGELIDGRVRWRARE